MLSPLRFPFRPSLLASNSSQARFRSSQSHHHSAGLHSVSDCLFLSGCQWLALRSNWRAALARRSPALACRCIPSDPSRSWCYASTDYFPVFGRLRRHLRLSRPVLGSHQQSVARFCCGWRDRLDQRHRQHRWLRRSIHRGRIEYPHRLFRRRRDLLNRLRLRFWSAFIASASQAAGHTKSHGGVSSRLSYLHSWLVLGSHWRRASR